MAIRDKQGSASGTTLHLPDKRGKLAFDNDGVATEYTAEQGDFLLKTFPDQFEEYEPLDELKETPYTGRVLVELTTLQGGALGTHSVPIAAGKGSLAINDPRPQGIGTREREEHLEATLETTRTELAEALAENVRLSKENADLNAKALELEQAAQAERDRKPQRELHREPAAAAHHPQAPDSHKGDKK